MPRSRHRVGGSVFGRGQGLPFVRLADESVHIGPSPGAAELSGDRQVDRRRAANRRGCGASRLRVSVGEPRARARGRRGRAGVRRPPGGRHRAARQQARRAPHDARRGRARAARRGRSAIRGRRARARRPDRLSADGQAIGWRRRSWHARGQRRGLTATPRSRPRGARPSARSAIRRCTSRR